MGALCLGAAAAAGMARLRFDADVLSLLPRDGRVVPAYRAYASSFGAIDDLYVVLTAPEGRGIAEYAGVVAAWAERLRATPGINAVDTGLPDGSPGLTWLAGQRLLLLPDDALDRALARLRGEGLADAVRSRRAMLAIPSPEVAAMVRHDPLGLYDLLRDQLGGAQAGVNIGVTGDGYVSEDGRSRLLVAKPAKPPFDADFSRALTSRLEALRAELARAPAAGDAFDDELPPLDVQFAGGHRIAVETEAVIRRESVMNTVGSLALILPLLFVVFRSPFLVVVGSLPSALALVCALGVLGLGGATLSTAATASSAMLFGLGVDGVVLLYVTYTLALGEGAEPAAAIDRTGGPAASMLLGMWTTAATFYGLRFVDFPSLEQLGVLIGHGMVICGVLTLVLVPALLPRRRPRAAVRSLSMPRFAAWVERRRGTILAVAAVATIGAGIAATRLRVEPTLDRLRSVTPGAELLQGIAPMFGLPDEVYIAVSRGPELEPLLEANERLRQALAQRLPHVPIQAPSTLLPSAAAQAERRSRIAQAGVSAPALRMSLREAEQTEGFKPGTFDPFLDGLPSVLAPEAITYEAYGARGLRDLIGRFVTRVDGEWLLATYAFPGNAADAGALASVVADADPGATLTGLPLVNEELAARFLPEFAKGLGIGTAMVILLVVLAFRDLRLSLLSLAPTALGITWAAGVLAMGGIALDLFALFAVVTLVGIGVDYGVHLVHRHQERGAAALATEELAPVILVAATITLLGYGTLVNSSYPPLRSIGLVTGVSILTLAAASLFVLPALLSFADMDDATSAGTETRVARSDASIRVAAIVPALNEAATIREVVAGLRDHVEATLVVDDGSTDATASLAARAGAQVVAHGSNRGKGHAVRTGLAWATARGFTHVLLLDGDMQHLPSEAPRLVEAARTGADVVLGQRRFSREGMPASRYHANRIGSRALSRLIGTRFEDTQCGFRLFRVDALRPLRLRATGYDIETEMLVKLARRGARFATVPVTAVYAGERSKLRPVRDTTRTCFLAVYYRYIERV